MRFELCFVTWEKKLLYIQNNPSSPSPSPSPFFGTGVHDDQKIPPHTHTSFPYSIVSYRIVSYRIFGGKPEALSRKPRLAHKISFPKVSYPPDTSKRTIGARLFFFFFLFFFSSSSSSSSSLFFWFPGPLWISDLPLRSSMSRCKGVLFFYLVRPGFFSSRG